MMIGEQSKVQTFFLNHKTTKLIQGCRELVRSNGLADASGELRRQGDDLQRRRDPGQQDQRGKHLSLQ